MSASARGSPRSTRPTPSISQRTGRRRDLDAWLAIVAGLVLVQLFPAGVEYLQYDRAAIAGGEWLRLITGNFVHYDWPHTVANLGVFAALCWLAGEDGRVPSWLVAASAGAVGLSLYFLADGVATYRGISGVDFSLLAWLLVRRIVQGGGWKSVAWLAVLLVVAAKSMLETITGEALLPTSAPAGVEVVGITHVVGLATGSAAGCVVWWYGSATQGRLMRSRPRARSSL